MNIRKFYFFTSFILGSLSVFGQTSQISYQATILDDAGIPISQFVAEPYQVIVRIWDQPIGGNLVWAERQPQDTSIYQGRFAILLGTGNAVPISGGGEEPHPDLSQIFTSGDRFIEMTAWRVGELAKTYETRQRMVSTATAFRAKVTESVVAGNIVGIAWQDGVLGSEKIEDNGVFGTSLADGAVKNRHLPAGSIATDQIADESLTSPDFADESLATAYFMESSITAVKIAPNAVTAGKLGVIESNDIASGSLTSEKVIDDSISRGALAGDVGSLTMLPSTKILRVVGRGTNTVGVAVGSQSYNLSPLTYGLPASGVKGLLLQVVGFPDDDGDEGTSVVCPCSDYQYASASRVNAAAANSLTIGRYDTNDTERLFVGTLFCPVEQLANGNYLMRLFYAHPSDRSGILYVNRGAFVKVSVIGYY